LLLAGLVVAFHIGRESKQGEVFGDAPVTPEMAKRKTEEKA